MIDKWDATFTAFMLLNDFVKDFTAEHPPANYTNVQADALHKHADLIAEKLTRPEFVYAPRHDAEGNFIPNHKRVPRERVS